MVPYTTSKAKLRGQCFRINLQFNPLFAKSIQKQRPQCPYLSKITIMSRIKIWPLIPPHGVLFDCLSNFFFVFCSFFLFFCFWLLFLSFLPPLSPIVSILSCYQLSSRRKERYGVSYGFRIFIALSANYT